MTASFKISEQKKNEILQEIKHFQKRKGNNFWFLFAKWEQISIHLYENNTLLLQGDEVKVNLFVKHFQIESKKKQQNFRKVPKKPPTIPYFGCDESGVGDLFGPIVITVFYLDQKMLEVIKKWKIRKLDPKEMSDKKVAELAEKLMLKKKYFATKIISNLEFNQKFQNQFNLKELLTVYYLELITKFVAKNQSREIIIDGYVEQKTFQKYQARFNLENNLKISLITKADKHHWAVAAAAIISRFLFLQTISKMEKQIATKIVLGASQKAKDLVKHLFQTKPREEVIKITKTGYKGVKELVDE